MHMVMPEFMFQLMPLLRLNQVTFRLLFRFVGHLELVMLTYMRPICQSLFALFHQMLLSQLILWYFACKIYVHIYVYTPVCNFFIVSLHFYLFVHIYIGTSTYQL